MIDANSYIIADTHFGHEGLVRYEPIRKQETRLGRYASVDQLMLQRWNESITKDSSILHLGDFAHKHPDIQQVASKLKGEKILLLGNHDKPKDVQTLRSLGWKIIDSVVVDLPYEERIKADSLLSSVSDMQRSQRLLCCLVTQIDDSRVMFTHFPLFDTCEHDAKYHAITDILELLFVELECSVNIHGHTHSRELHQAHSINACVEVVNFRPRQLHHLLADKRQNNA